MNANNATRPIFAPAFWLLSWVLVGPILIIQAHADEEPRAARSVHLWWPAPEGDLFYNEMTMD